MECLAFGHGFDQNEPMKIVRGRRWLVMATFLVVGALRATAGEDSYFGQPLVQVRFDQLVPTTHPIVTPKFDRLLQTDVPLTDPGVARVPITDNLIHPLEQPLLIASEGLGLGQITQVTPTQPTSNATARRAGERTR